MFVAMNRFKIALGNEQAFIAVWKNRETHLDKVPGFKQFHLLQGPSNDQYTLFASHSVWESRQAFEDWTRSEAFRMAHAGAGSTKPLYIDKPQFEGFEAVV